MPTVPGTYNHYLEFFKETVKEIDCLVRPEEIVWHYTNGQSLIQIIKSGVLWSTQVGTLNDTTEVRYAAGKLRTALLELLPRYPLGSPISVFMQRYVDLITQQSGTPDGAEIEYFVTCFTTLKDDLGQWRSYGGGENGYAIGIQAGDLWGVPGESMVAKVNYRTEVHDALAKKTAEATAKFYQEGLDPRIDGWDEKFLEAWDATLMHLAPLFKDPGFSIENEVRVIHRLSSGDFDRLVVVQKKSIMSRHLPLQFPKGGGTEQKPKLPIAEVMVGPARHKEMSRVSVDTLLRINGYAEGLVTSSGLPYQEI
jgi:hypothetical protein